MELLIKTKMCRNKQKFRQKIIRTQLQENAQAYLQVDRRNNVKRN